MSDGIYKRYPNSGVLFVHKKGKHPDLMYDGNVEIDMEAVCPCGCGHKFTASGSFFLDGYRPKSEKVLANLRLKQKNQSFTASESQKPAAQSNQYGHQAPMNYGGAKPTAKTQDKLIDDEIPF